MKKILLIIFSIFLFLIIFCIFLYTQNPYYIRINIKFNNMSATKIDDIFAKDLKDNILNIENVNELIIFSKQNNLNLYCKINPFIVNKNKTIQNIELGLNNFISNIDDDIKKNIEINFDYEYHKKYDYFLLIYSNNINYNNLKTISDKIYDKLTNKKLTSKIKIFGEQQRTIYLLYDTNNFLKYDVNLNDIQNILKNNNIIQNKTIENNLDKIYTVEFDTELKNIENIKKIPIYFKDNNFSTTFENVFDIVDLTKMPSDYYINFDNSKTILFALCKKRFTPKFILKKQLNDFIKNEQTNINLKIIDTSKYSKIELYLDSNSNIDFTYNLKEKLLKLFKNEDIEDTLFFIGIDLAKTSKKEDFLELDYNKLIIYTNKKYINKIYNILDKNNINYIKNKKAYIFEDFSLENVYNNLKNIKKPYSNFTTYKNLKIDYIIDNFSLNDYSLDKKEISNTLFANKEGLFCGYLYTNSTKIPILIKNKNKKDEQAIYSKKYKTFLYLDSFAKKELKEEYHSIVRKNGKYYLKIRY